MLLPVACGPTKTVRSPNTMSASTIGPNLDSFMRSGMVGIFSNVHRIIHAAPSRSESEEAGLDMRQAPDMRRAMQTVGCARRPAALRGFLEYVAVDLLAVHQVVHHGDHDERQERCAEQSADDRDRHRRAQFRGLA